MPELRNDQRSIETRSCIGNQAFADCCVLMLSSMGLRGDSARCREVGIAAYLAKPIKQSELLDVILVTLGVRPGGRTAHLVTRHTVRGGFVSRRILLAEDNEVNQRVAKMLLQRQGHKVTIVSNGRQAVHALANAHFDLVLMDVQMPEMDGVAATQAIRRREAKTGGHIPIAAMTAHGMHGDRERFLAAGMDSYVMKPLKAEALTAVIHELMALKPRSESSSDVATEETIDAPMPAPVPEPEDELGEAPTDPAARLAAPAPAADAPLSFDPGVLVEEISLEDARELGEIFQATLPDLLRSIRDAVSSEDAEALRVSGHTLKGSVSNFGAKRAAECAARLEEIGKSGDLSGAQAAQRELELALETLLTDMKRFFASADQG